MTLRNGDSKIEWTKVCGFLVMLVLAMLSWFLIDLNAQVKTKADKADIQEIKQDIKTLIGMHMRDK